MMRRRRRDRGTDPDAAFAWFQAVTRGKRCVVCEHKHPQMQAHHAVEQQVLRREFPHGALFVSGDWLPVDRYMAVDESDPFRSLQELLWDKRNGIPLCPADHEGHTSHMRKVPIAKLPAAVFVFATELGLQHRLGPRFYAAA
jgi:hypothetical protein